jgi:exosortase
MEAPRRMGDRPAVAAPPERGSADFRHRLFGGDESRAPVALCVLAATAYAFWPTLARLYSKWIADPQYSHGLLVPLFAAGLLWTKRDRFPASARPAPLPGLALLALAVAGRVLGGVIYFEWLEAFSLLPFLAGLLLIFGGYSVVKWAGPAVAFLFFMIPMPYRVEIQLGAPLQRAATIASTYVLQTLGQPALADGNTILIKEFKLGIVEACSGLRMLVTFVTFSTAVCMVVQKPASDKLLILLSAIPIALVVNITRIVVTGWMYLHVDGQTAHLFFHDLAGWFMMPMALGLLWVELWVLRHLFTDLPGRAAAR